MAANLGGDGGIAPNPAAAGPGAAPANVHGTSDGMPDPQLHLDHPNRGRAHPALDNGAHKQYNSRTVMGDNGGAKWANNGDTRIHGEPFETYDKYWAAVRSNETDTQVHQALFGGECGICDKSLNGPEKMLLLFNGAKDYFPEPTAPTALMPKRYTVVDTNCWDNRKTEGLCKFLKLSSKYGFRAMWDEESKIAPPQVKRPQLPNIPGTTNQPTSIGLDRWYLIWGRKFQEKYNETTNPEKIGVGVNQLDNPDAYNAGSDGKTELAFWCLVQFAPFGWVESQNFVEDNQWRQKLKEFRMFGTILLIPEAGTTDGQCTRNGGANQIDPRGGDWTQTDVWDPRAPWKSAGVAFDPNLMVLATVVNSMGNGCSESMAIVEHCFREAASKGGLSYDKMATKIVDAFLVCMGTIWHVEVGEYYFAKGHYWERYHFMIENVSIMVGRPCTGDTIITFGSMATIVFEKEELDQLATKKQRTSLVVPTYQNP